MIIIRDSQWRQLQIQQERAFLEKLARHVCKVFPTHVQSLDSTTLIHNVAMQYLQAKAAGFTTERNIALFIDLFYGIGDNFLSQTRYEYLCEPLLDNDLSEDSRIYLSYKRLPNDDIMEPAHA